MAHIARHDDIRVQNRQSVIEAVRVGDIASRTDVSNVTGLSASTVSAITSDLLSEGVLIQAADDAVDEMNSSGSGRQKKAIDNKQTSRKI